ncbi:TldD/PmbA family protein [Kozakia baliensis]|uniref:Modulator protein n=1 Tax=Kozakia baliensis TaxID=153496 RepID=A0A1D8URV8_9PROT|nr:TldD/PmbA family protein [Kozakia baliensis]AOX16360.1 modulator protein [Kozakia baliensis]GEL63572.1 modulator protein [Kozakia baliensis]
MTADPQLLQELLKTARKCGADRADAMLVSSTAISALCRKGVPEGMEHSETTGLGLRVFVGQRAAIVSATELTPGRFEQLAQQAVAMARVVPEDRYAGLGDPATQGIADIAALDIVDTHAAPDLPALLTRARMAEEAALAVNGVTNTNGASASYGRMDVALADSQGFAGNYARTSHSTSVSVLAGEGAQMQRDYAGHSVVHLSDLDDAETLGREAGERAVQRLNPTKPRTGQFPIVYDKRVSGSLLSHLAGAINGAAIARGTSFLAKKRGGRILPLGLSVIDDPLRHRGMRSRPFDAEGFRAAPLNLVEDGILTEWVLDSRSARQLGLTSNGRASRGTGSSPSPSISNLYLSGGDIPFDDLLSDIREGILINELMGSSVNGLTGDYSRGASGFMIRDGKIAEPVAELTIAGNLIDMFQQIRAADDLEFRRGVDAPTIRIDGMSIAGA